MTIVETSEHAWAAAIDTALMSYGVRTCDADTKLVSVSENATYVVDPKVGTRFVVRLHRPGYRSLQEIRSEVAWIEALQRDHVVATPPIRTTLGDDTVATFANGSGELQHAVAFEFVEGASPDTADSAQFVRIFRGIGELTARLHQHARRWKRPETFERPRWTLTSAIGELSDYADWRDHPLLDAGSRDLLEAVEALVRSEVEAYESAGGRVELIHGDLRSANLLVHHGRATVIDFDDCGIGWLPWDLACSLSFIESEPSVPALVDAWLDGYQRASRLEEHELAVIPSLVMIRRLQLVGWMMVRQGTPEHQRLGHRFLAGTVDLGQRILDRTFLPDLYSQAA